MKIKLLIVDDHPMMRESIMNNLKSKSENYTFLIDEAKSAEEAIEKAETIDYDFIIMDNQLPDRLGAEATAIILNHKPSIKILAFSDSDDTDTIRSFFNAGAKGIILKRIHTDEFIRAIEDVLAGKMYYSSEITTRLLITEVSSTKLNDQLLVLTRREIEVLRLIEHPSREIAKKLNITQKTVDGHRAKLFEKLQIKNALGLLKFAFQSKLIDINVKDSVLLPPHLLHISTQESLYIHS